MVQVLTSRHGLATLHGKVSVNVWDSSLFQRGVIFEETWPPSTCQVSCSQLTPIPKLPRQGFGNLIATSCVKAPQQSTNASPPSQNPLLSAKASLYGHRHFLKRSVRQSKQLRSTAKASPPAPARGISNATLRLKPIPADTSTHLSPQLLIPTTGPLHQCTQRFQDCTFKSEKAMQTSPHLRTTLTRLAMPNLPPNRATPALNVAHS